MRVKIMICVDPSDPSKGRKWQEVEGRHITFSGFKGYDFILHEGYQSLYDWHVAEATTGMYFAQGNTPNEVMHQARETLNKQGIKGIEKGLERARKTFAEIPLIEEKQNATN